MQILGKRYVIEKKMNKALDSALQKSINLAKSFKKSFINCKNAGMCNIRST
jgi:hypothetical protein